MEKLITSGTEICGENWRISIMNDNFLKTAVNNRLDRNTVSNALARAVRKALIFHKQTGHPIVTMRDGKVVKIEPEDINIFDLDEECSI
ncbi:hypothetical protein ACFLQJ_00625 [Calditrichota bacterium]